MYPIDQLKKGDILPFLSFPEAFGGEVRTGDYRGRGNLVLLLTHPAGCPACEKEMRGLHASLDQLRSEDAEVLAVVPGPPHQVMELQRQLALAFPVLIDARGAPGGEAILAVADRFGEIFAIWRSGQDHQLPTIAEIAEELAFIALQCPE